MTKKIVFGVVAVAAAALVLAPAASAACGSVRTASTYNSGTHAYNYWHAPSGDTAASGTLVGQTWQLGNPNQFNTGNCNDIDVGNPTPGFLYFGGGGIGLNMHIESCGNGCPSQVPGVTLAVAAEKRSPSGSEFLVATVVETPGGAINFDYSTQGNHNFVAIPRPTVTGSSKAGTAVNLNLSVPAVSGGLYGPNAASAVLGYNILSAAGTSDPGRNAAAYTSAGPTITASGGGPAVGTAQVSCANPAQDQWVVTQVVFEGNVGSSAVSAARRVNCNPALADPKFKIVPKKGDTSLQGNMPQQQQ